VPELPEIVVWARQFRAEIIGKTIAAVETPQPKCLNAPPEEVAAFLPGRGVKDARERGKWLILDLAPDGHLLLNLGMGGDFHYRRPDARSAASSSAAPSGGLPPGASPSEKYQFKLTFSDGSELALRFWWFGYVHIARSGELARHAMTASLGLSPLDPDMDLTRFRRMVAARPRRSVKSFLLDQKVLAGIGNVYAQDPLWGARLHPDRRLGSLSPAEVDALWASLRGVLERSIAKGGLAYERDLHGHPGGYGHQDHDVAYRPGEPCPRCGTAIQKVKTGATSTHLCPECQKL
jgi:formamidopyrimidine-DNA glycosylase